MNDIESGVFAIEKPNLAIDGSITVQLKSGRHFTYRLKTVRQGDLEGKRLAELLSGPDNVRSYHAFGFVKKNRIGVYYIAVWHKYRTEKYQKHKNILEGSVLSLVEQYLQSGRCIKCGRKLTTPESIAKGMGPVCAQYS